MTAPGATSGAYAAVATLDRIAADRPRCSDGDRRQRTQQVLVRLTPDELADARRLAAQHAMSVPELLRAGLTLFTATEATR